LGVSSLVWIALKITNSWVVQEWGNKSTCVGLVVTMLIRVRIPSLVSTMSTHWQKELNVAKGSAYNYFLFHAKASISHNGNKHIANYIMSLRVPMACKKWIPIWLTGCVHTHWGRLVMKGVIILATFKAFWKELRKIRLGILINYKPTACLKIRTW
jgi:hypothetical protein